MKQSENDLYEKGFNAGFYLDFYAPNVLVEVLRGLNGSRDAFFAGMRDGQAQNRLEMAQQQEKDLAADKEKDAVQQRTAEREREAAYQERLKREAEAREQKNAEIEAQIKQEFDQDPLEQERLKELEEIREGQGKDRNMDTRTDR